MVSPPLCEKHDELDSVRDSLATGVCCGNRPEKKWADVRVPYRTLSIPAKDQVHVA